jgi:hypothetical protein
MNARKCCGSLVAAVCVTLLAADGARASSQGNNKSIFVSVLDAEGRPVTGMTVADFAIREDNADRTIVDVKPASQPIYIAMLVDTSTAATGFIQDIREGFSVFVKGVLGKSPQSQLSLWEFGQAAVRVENFTTDLAKLTDKINRLFPRLNASSVLSEALNDASNDLAKKPGPRRAIVMLNIEPSTEESQEQPQKINESLIRSHAQLWAVSVQKGTLRNAKRDVVLNTLVRNAGGMREYIVAESAAPTQLARIADALTSQYEITYVRPGDSAKIVQVGQRTGKDLKIVTGIFAPK